MTTTLEAATQLYAQLQPLARTEYVKCVMTRTPAPLQEDMAALVANDLPPEWDPDPAAGNFFYAILALGGQVSAARQVLYNNLFISLRTAGALPFLSRLGVMAAEDEIEACTDLINPTRRLALNGALAFTVDQGYVGGAAKWIDTGHDPTAPGSGMSRDNSCYAAGSLSGRTAGADTVLIGNVQVSGAYGLYPRATGDVLVCDNANAPFGSILTPYPSPSVKGLWHSDRSGATTRQLSFNGVQVQDSAQASAAPATGKSILLGAWRNTDGTTVYANADDNLCCWYAGAAMAPSMRLAVFEALNDYMTAVGSPLV